MALIDGEKQGQECARDQIDGADIHVHHAVEIFGLGGFNGADVADACIVDQNVEELELREGRGDGFGAGDVEVQRAGGGN